MSDLGVSSLNSTGLGSDPARLVPDPPQDERQILGLRFYVGDVHGAIDRVSRGGLLVVPSAPTLKDIVRISPYRDALIDADVVIPDSAYMVLAWNLIERDSIARLSGLKYLRELLFRPDVREPGNTFWVMPSPGSRRRNLDWLSSQGITVPSDCVYDAPLYSGKFEDPDLVERLKKLRPQHVVICIGGGSQECLGLYIKRQLDYLPAIHCIGAAIAFLSGDQVQIPEWADRMYLGWLFRCVSSPRNYIRRYSSAVKLFPLIWRHRSQLPA